MRWLLLVERAFALRWSWRDYRRARQGASRGRRACSRRPPTVASPRSGPPGAAACLRHPSPAHPSPAAAAGAVAAFAAARRAAPLPQSRPPLPPPLSTPPLPQSSSSSSSSLSSSPPPPPLPPPPPPLPTPLPPLPRVPPPLVLLTLQQLVPAPVLVPPPSLPVSGLAGCGASYLAALASFQLENCPHRCRLRWHRSESPCASHGGSRHWPCRSRRCQRRRRRRDEQRELRCIRSLSRRRRRR